MFQFSPNFTESISKMFHDRLYTTNWLNKYTLIESRKKKIQMELWGPMESNRTSTRDLNALGIELPFKSAIRQCDEQLL